MDIKAAAPSPGLKREHGRIIDSDSDEEKPIVQLKRIKEETPSSPSITSRNVANGVSKPMKTENLTGTLEDSKLRTPSKPSPASSVKPQGNRVESDDDDDDKPLSKRLFVPGNASTSSPFKENSKNGSTTQKPIVKSSIKSSSSSSSSSSDEENVPLSKMKASFSAPSSTAIKTSASAPSSPAVKSSNSSSNNNGKHNNDDNKNSNSASKNANGSPLALQKKKLTSTPKSAPAKTSSAKVVKGKRAISDSESESDNSGSSSSGSSSDGSDSDSDSDSDNESDSDSSSGDDSSSGSGSSSSSDGDDDDSDDSSKKKSQKKAAPKKKSSIATKKTSSAKSAANSKPAASSKKSKASSSSSPKKEGEESEKKRRSKAKAAEEEEDTYKWWEEGDDPALEDGEEKWKTMSHNGVMFAPPYLRLPSNVHLLYNGQPVKLSEPAEEVAGFYASMINSDYVHKPKFNENFFSDWRKVMTSEERNLIKDLSKCNFQVIADHFARLREERKAMTKEQKAEIKKQNEALVEKYGFCTMDGRKERIANFRLEPPGLFRGRGEHPKMGLIKKRLQAEDVIINVSKDSPVPPPPAGHKWKEVIHNPLVGWLASWTENIQNQNKYVMLNAASKLKGLNDMKKYEKARELKKHILRIRKQYTEDLRAREMALRQRATALHLIDRLALRCGNEKDTDETADTVGCCSLRFEHVKLEEPNTVHLDFLGKDSIRYQNTVVLDDQVFKNLRIFKKDKSEGDAIFDRLTPSNLNKHLQSLMPGLTAKVFRTFNASITLQEQLLSTPVSGNANEKLLAYNRANRAVAILCNHQRSVPKKFQETMDRINEKIGTVEKELKEAKKELKEAKESDKNVDKAQTKVDRLKARIAALEIEKTDKDENKQIALSTSKLNYLDPRISVAWCKRFDVPVEKIYNKTQRKKFAWALGVPKNFEF